MPGDMPDGALEGVVAGADAVAGADWVAPVDCANAAVLASKKAVVTKANVLDMFGPFRLFPTVN